MRQRRPPDRGLIAALRTLRRRWGGCGKLRVDEVSRGRDRADRPRPDEKSAPSREPGACREERAGQMGTKPSPTSYAVVAAAIPGL
jgi:hypothetical protein